MKRPEIITKIFGLFKKAEEVDLSKDIKELKEIIEHEENSEPKKEEPKDKIQVLADELLDQMKRV